MNAYLKRLLSLALVLTMVVSCVPAVTVWAAEEAVRPGTVILDMENLPAGELRDSGENPLVKSWWEGGNASTNVSFTAAAGKGVDGSAALKVGQIGNNNWNDTFMINIKDMGVTVTDWSGYTKVWMYVDASEAANNLSLELGNVSTGNSTLAAGSAYYTVNENGTVNQLGTLSEAYGGAGFAVIPVVKGFTGWLGVDVSAFGAGNMSNVQSLRFYMRSAYANDVLYIDEICLTEPAPAASVRPGTVILDMEALPEGELLDDNEGGLVQNNTSTLSTRVSFTAAAGKGVDGSKALKVYQKEDNGWNDTFNIQIGTMGASASDWTGSGMIWLYVDGSELINNVNLELGLGTANSTLAVGAPYYTMDRDGNVTKAGNLPAAWNGANYSKLPVAKGFTGWLGIPSYAFGYAKLSSVTTLRFYMREAKAGDVLYIDEIALSSDSVDPVPPVDGLELVWNVNNVTPDKVLYEGSNGSYIDGTTAYGGGALRYNGGGWTNHVYAAVDKTNDWRGASKLWCYIDGSMNNGGDYNLGLGIMDGNWTQLVSGGFAGWSGVTCGVQNATTGQMDVKNLGDWGWLWMDANYKGWIYFDLQQIAQMSGKTIDWTNVKYVGIKAESAVTYYADSFHISREVVDVTGVTLDKTTMTLTEGQTNTLIATVSPENATYPEVTWSSNNEAVAKVENGVVTAVSAGEAVITATAGSCSATCAVTVKSNVKTYTITVSANEGGKVSPSGRVTVNEGNAQTFTVTPAPAYEVKSFKINGQEVALSGNTYTISNVSANMTVDVVFGYAPALIWDMNDIAVDGSNLAEGVSADNELNVIATEEASGDVALQWYSDAWANMVWVSMSSSAVTDWIVTEEAWLWAHVKNTGSDQIKFGLNLQDGNGKNYAPTDDKNGSVKYAIEVNGTMQEGKLGSWGWIEYIPVGFDGWIKVKLTGTDSMQAVKGDLDWSNISTIGFKADSGGSFIIDDIRADIDTSKKRASYTVVHMCGDTVLGTETITEIVDAAATTITVTQSALEAGSFVNYEKTGASVAAGSTVAIGGQVVITYAEKQTMQMILDMNDIAVDGTNLGANVSTNDGSDLSVTAIEEAEGDIALLWNSNSGYWCDYLYIPINDGNHVTDWVWNEDGYLWAYIKNTGSSQIKLGITAQDVNGNNYRPTGEYYSNVKYSTIVGGVETEGYVNSWGWIFVNAGFEGWIKLKMVGHNSMASVMGELDWTNITHIGFKSDNGGTFVIDDVTANLDFAKKHASYTVVHKCGDLILEKENVIVVTDLDAQTVAVQAGTLDAKPFLNYKKTGAEMAEGDMVAVGGEVVVTYKKAEESGAQSHIEVIWNVDNAANDYSYGDVATLNAVDYNGGKAYQWTSTDWANIVNVNLTGTGAVTDWTGATQLWLYVDASSNPCSNNLNLGLSVTDASGNELKPGQGEYYADVKAYYQADGDTSIRETKLASWGWLTALPGNFKGWVGVQLTGDYGYYTALANNGKISSFDFANIAYVGFKNEQRGAECSMIVDDFAISKVAETNNTAPYFFVSTKGQHFRRMPTTIGKAVNVCWYAMDNENNAFTYSVVKQPANGTATIDDRGNVYFVPSALGESTLTIAVTDVYGASSTLDITTYVGARDEIRIAAIGDSITNGVGSSNNLYESYPAQLQALLDATGGNYHVENFGMGGIKLMTGTGYSMDVMPMKYAAKEYVPDIAIIMLGSNDAWQETEEKISADFESEMRLLIAEFVAINPDIQILLCTTPYRSDASSSNARPNGLTENYMLPAERAIAEELDYVTLVDINALLTQEILGDSYYMADYTHPNAEGYALLAKEVYDTMMAEDYVKQWNLILGDDIGVNFYAELTEEQAANAYAKITVAGDSIEVAATTKNAEGYYVFSVNVAAAQMTEAITVQLYIDGVCVEIGKYTVEGYAQYILADETRSDEVKQLVTDMLNYGGAAQVYFGYNTDALANADLTGAGTEDLPAEAPSFAMSGAVDGIRYYGASLVFENRTAVRLYFQTDDISGYSFAYNGTALKATEKGGLYYVEIDDIAPQALAEAITVTVTAGGQTMSVTYSPVDYMARMAVKGTDAMKTLVRALYNYYLAAQDYTN